MSVKELQACKAGTMMSPFLALPRNLRVQIYNASGILGSKSCTLISLNSRRRPAFHYDLEGFQATYDLLLTSQTVYEEVAAEVYANNHFFIRVIDTHDLSALRRLRTTSLRAIKWLTIHLNVASCGLGLFCDSSLRPWEIAPAKPGRDKPLCLTRSVAEVAPNELCPWHLVEPAHRILNEWHRTWEDQIRPSLTVPRQLHMNFICDVADYPTGFMAVQPFLEGMYFQLAGCSIRLSHRRDADLLSLAERAVTFTQAGTRSPMRTSEAKTPVRKAFRLLDLPPELRQNMLAYTDLVTPFKEVEWAPSCGMSFCFRRDYDLDHHPCPQMAHGCCALPDPIQHRWKAPCTPCWDRSFPNCCFCRAHHSAASTVYTCHCWSPPTSIFLTSRAVRQDALRVFFTMNRFIVTPDLIQRDYTMTQMPLEERMPALVFLSRAVPEDGMKYLRFLEFNFQPILRHEHPAYCHPRSPEWYDWTHTLELVKNHLNLPKLTIRVFFAGWWPPFYSGLFPPELPDSDYRHIMGDEESEVMRKAYVDTLVPLQKLKGLGRFFVHLSDPILSCFEDSSRIRRLVEEEEALERTVMGEDYDALKAGKEEETKSRWMCEHAKRAYDPLDF